MNPSSDVTRIETSVGGEAVLVHHSAATDDPHLAEARHWLLDHSPLRTIAVSVAIADPVKRALMINAAFTALGDHGSGLRSLLPVLDTPAEAGTKAMVFGAWFDKLLDANRYDDVIWYGARAIEVLPPEPTLIVNYLGALQHLPGREAAPALRGALRHLRLLDATGRLRDATLAATIAVDPHHEQLRELLIGTARPLSPEVSHA